MNPVLTLTYNNLELVKKCVDSIRRQTIPTAMMVIDNGSTDNTNQWLRADQWPFVHSFGENRGVSRGWNFGLNELFSDGWPHVLVVGSDTVLPPSFYADLLSLNLPFVTGCGYENMEQAVQAAWLTPLDSHPEFNAFLIRREVWEKVGEFDEQMVNWASDCDYHVRAHRLGVPMWKAGVPFYHYGSATLKNSDPEAQRVLHERGNLDRDVFRSKYGCVPGTEEYSKLFES